jgi:hypothetical protein
MEFLGIHCAGVAGGEGILDAVLIEVVAQGELADSRAAGLSKITERN